MFKWCGLKVFLYLLALLNWQHTELFHQTPVTSGNNNVLLNWQHISFLLNWQHVASGNNNVLLNWEHTELFHQTSVRRHWIALPNCCCQWQPHCLCCQRQRTAEEAGRREEAAVQDAEGEGEQAVRYVVARLSLSHSVQSPCPVPGASVCEAL